METTVTLSVSDFVETMEPAAGSITAVTREKPVIEEEKSKLVIKDDASLKERQAKRKEEARLRAIALEEERKKAEEERWKQETARNEENEMGSGARF